MMKKILLLLLLLLCLVSCGKAVMPEKPADTSLPLWICQDVADYDFSAYHEIKGWMGAREFAAPGYEVTDNADGMQTLPEEYVTFLITAYPDYSDGGQFVTTITITDPKVSVFGVTCSSEKEAFASAMTDAGFSVEDKTEPEVESVLFRISALSPDKRYSLFLTRQADGNSILVISAPVSNKRGIVF